MTEDVERTIKEAMRRFRSERPQRRADLRARRERTRDAMKRAKLDARARIENDPQLLAARRRTRNRRVRNVAILALIIALLLLLFSQCECDPPVPAIVDAGIADVDAGTPLRVVTPKKSTPGKKHDDRVGAKKRGDFAQPEVAPPPWLDALHLQVAARSRRLAACFAGAAVPGALRWTAAVDAKSGDVSDSTLEPVGTQVALTGSQQECLQQVLRDPKYKLPVDDDEALTKHASMLIEF